MAEQEPGDDQLRSAFESFRSEALDAVSPAGPQAVRVAARQRHRARVAMVGAAAAVALVVVGGAGLLATHHSPLGPQRNTAAAPSGLTRHTTPSADRQPDASRQPAPGRSEPTRSAGDDAGTHTWALDLATRAAPLSLADTGSYAGILVVTVDNHGSRAIPHTVVTLTAPMAVTFAGHGSVATCTATSICQLQSIDGLAPGASRTITGTLTYRAPGGQQADAAWQATVGAVATAADGTELTKETQMFTVSVGTPSGPPGDDPTPTDPPTPTPSGSTALN